jgi:hypothetical protein
MPDSDKDPLRELLKRELDAFAAEVAGTEGSMSADRIEMLNGLAKLIETRDSLRSKPRNWWPALVLAGTLVIVSVLLFARVRETEIELDISVAQLSFALANAQVLSGATDLSTLGVSGLRDVQLPNSQSSSGNEIAPAQSQEPVLFLTASAEGQHHGNVTLAPLVLPSNAQVRLACSDVVNQYGLSLNTMNFKFEAAVYGAVTISLPGSSKAFDFATPKQIVMQGGSQEVNLDLTFPSLPQSALSPQLEVREIGFTRIDQFLEPNQTLVKRLSTIVSGTLFLESLNGQAFPLRPGEELKFEHSQGEIRSLVLAAHHIDLKYRGRVTGMTAGTGDGRRSIMPTYLEWLKARHSLSLFWATSLYLFGLATAALRWFGVRA